MTPYYERAGVTLYHADCRDVLPVLEQIDVVLTDPPYGVKGARSGGRKRAKAAYAGGFEDTPAYVREVIVPVVEYLIVAARCVVVTPGNANLSAYPQPDSFGAFYQPAAVGMQSFGFVDAQPIFYYGTAGGGRVGKRCSWLLTESPAPCGHPCRKPLIAWRRLLANVSGKGDVVVDPFVGSGTTLRAAKDLGLRAIGVELEESYCEMAARYLDQDVLPLFEEAAS